VEQRWESYPFGGFLVLSLFAFFLPAPTMPSGPPVSDKFEHAAIFFLLAVTGRFAGHRTDALLIGLLGYAVVSEVLQAVLPVGRSGDPADAFADAVGVVLGLGAWWLLVALLDRRKVSEERLRQGGRADRCPCPPHGSARSSPRCRRSGAISDAGPRGRRRRRAS
jgi:VanZ family protein